jgi:hypothetical protein
MADGLFVIAIIAAWPNLVPIATPKTAFVVHDFFASRLVTSAKGRFRAQFGPGDILCVSPGKILRRPQNLPQGNTAKAVEI